MAASNVHLAGYRDGMPVRERVLQMKISLVGVSKPPVWRRVLVPATMRLDRLHDVIQRSR